MSEFEKEILKISKKYQKRNSLLNLYIEYDIESMNNDIKKYFDIYNQNLYDGKYNETKSIWNDNFYKHILKLTKKLTIDEAEFLTNYYLNEKKEKEIKEIMDIDKDTLEQIKESCMIKTWYFLNDNKNKIYS